MLRPSYRFIFVLILLTLSIPYFSYAQEIYINPSVVDTNVGASFNVNVMVRNIYGLSTFEFGVSFNKNVIEAVSMSKGSLWNNPSYLWYSGTIDNSLGMIDFTIGAASSETDPIGINVDNNGGSLATINFLVVGKGSSPITLNNVTINQVNGDIINAGVLNGYVNSINTLPVASNLAITPTSPKMSDDLVGSYTYTDADGDPQGASEINWYKNGVLQVSYTTLTVPSSALSVGDNWYFTVKPYDGWDYGTLQTSTTVTIITAGGITVELRDSNGALITNSGATILYQPNSNGAYVNFGDGILGTSGSKTENVATGIHRFKLTYQACTQDKQQNVSTNPTVLFQTKFVTVELRNSTNAFITDSGATITWQPGSAGSYVNFGDGVVNADGKESMEVLPLIHRFRLKYQGTQDKQQNISTNPTVLFQTKFVTVELRNSTNAFITDSGATITWQPGSAGSYVNFGDGVVNADGKESMEVLPLTHRFRLTYQTCTQDKQQNVSTKPTLLFKTYLVTVELIDSKGTLVRNTNAIVVWQPGSAGYYVNFGDGILHSNGQESMEVLPLTHRFRMTYNGGTQEKQSSSTKVTYKLALFPANAPQWYLLANFPNPFNPETWIPYAIKDGVDVTIRIHDVSGRLIKTLSLGYQSPGFYTSQDKAAYWDGRNEAGEQVSSGIYFYNIKAGDFTATHKMLMLK
jgi:hypothetical protein